jgi:protein gp37
MAEDSKIQWTTHTMNPWRGCTKVSAGCANCYAETMSGRNPKVLGVWGPNGTRVVASEAQWRLPPKWDKAAALAGERHRVFCASLADVFEDWRGPMHDASGNRLHRGEGWVQGTVISRHWYSESPCDDEPEPLLTMGNVRFRLFDLIEQTPHLDWLLLTKRPENVLGMTYDRWCKKVPGHVSQNEGDGRRWDCPRNVWLGASVENRAEVGRIDVLRRVPAAVRFLSVEPLLEDLGRLDLSGIDWCIVGGESGRGARPMNVEWVRSLVRQCQSAGVKVFVKQMGSNPQFQTADMHGPQLLTLRDRKGGDAEEWPEDLRVREFPR